MRLLAASDKTPAQLYERLTARGFDEKDSAAAIEKLKKEGFLNENAYAEKTVRRLYENHYGKDYITAYLQSKTFSAEAAEHAASVMKTLDFSSSAKQYYKLLINSGKTKNQALAALYKRGFSDILQYN